jgi:hypothetical protein
VEACRTALYADLATRLERRVARWATSSLSLFGRTYVARQCFASMLTYHAMFLPPPSPFLRRAVDLLAHFVALGERVTPGRRAASLYPNRAVVWFPELSLSRLLRGCFGYLWGVSPLACQ